jgi:hypothetical protein
MNGDRVVGARVNHNGRKIDVAALRRAGDGLLQRHPAMVAANARLISATSPLIAVPYNDGSVIGHDRAAGGRSRKWRLG